MARHASRAVRRAPVIAIIATGLLAGGVLDRAGASRVDRALESESVPPVPVAAPAGALSSSWFCAGATEVRKPYAVAQVVVANAGSAPATGTVHVIGSSGKSATTAITVPPGASAAVNEAVPGGGTWTGAVVDVDAGAVAVSQVIDGPFGRTTSPCATSGSSTWYLPTGQTRINASETILLLNPFTTASIVDLSFSTNDGNEFPLDFQGLDVPPGGLLAVPLGSHLRRRAAIATSVSARSGAVVAWEAEVVTPPGRGQTLVGTAAAAAPLADPASPIPGITVMLGAPSAGTSWVWPDGLAGPNLDEQYVVFNPSGRSAQVRLAFGLPRGSAEPLDITVGPYQVVPVVAERQPRIPSGIPHTVSLVSTNGVPVVAARSVSASNAIVGGLAGRIGLGLMLGERMSASNWVIPTPPVDFTHQANLYVENPGSAQVTVVVHGLAGGEQSVPIGPGGRAAFAIPPGRGGAPLEVAAPAPIYVELDLYGARGVEGYSLSSAVPLT